MKKRLLSMLASVIFVMPLLFCFGNSQGSTAYAANSFGLNPPTQQQIIDRYKQLNIDTDRSVTYSKKYSLSQPYAAGDVSSADRQNALNMLNFVRYVAGLPADVQLNDDYNKLTQAASLINAVNGSLSHFPTQPSGMSDELYELGLDGASSSNIGMGYSNITQSIIYGYMNDSDPSNIDRVGHRRWILNPDMQYTGFGYVDYYTALYSFDFSRSATFTGDYIAWPSKNMPMELYGSSYGNYAFSVNLGDAYDTPDISKVKVTVTSKRKNKTWTLDKSDNGNNYSEYLNVNNDGYGMSKCIIFNVGKFDEGDTVSVKINGIYKNGVEVPISYDVNFFAINHKHDFTSKVTKNATCTQEGVKTYTCTICGEQKTEKIAKTNHTYKSAVTKAATCTANGVKTYTCSVCKNTYTEAIKATGHKYAWTTDKAATCTSEGVKTQYCTVCKAKGDTASIPKTEHKFGAYVVKQKPTTTKEGIEERTCSACGAKEQRTIAKLSAQTSATTASTSKTPSTGKTPSTSKTQSTSKTPGTSTSPSTSSKPDSSSATDESQSSESTSSTDSTPDESLPEESTPTVTTPAQSSSAEETSVDSSSAIDSSSSESESSENSESSDASSDSSSEQTISGSSQSNNDKKNIPLIVGICSGGVLVAGIIVIVIKKIR